MHLIPNLNTNKGKFPAKVYTRGGTKSPYLILIQYKNRWVTPYEQDRIGLHLEAVGALQVMYSGVKFEELICRENPFLKMLRKDDPFSSGKYVPIPIDFK